MSIRIKDLPPKAGQISNSTKIPTEDPIDELNKTRMVSASDLTAAVYAASDEDSPLATGLLYVTETPVVARSIKDVAISLKNAPTGGVIEVDILKEDALNSDTFSTIFSTRPQIMVGEFTSATGIPPILSDNAWEGGLRMQFVLTINDTNFAATGLKVVLKS